MFDKIPNIEGVTESLNPLKHLGAPVRLLKAFKESVVNFFTAKDKGLMERIQVAIESFKKEWKGVIGEESKVSAETQATVKKSYDETVEGAQKTFALNEGVEQKDKDVFNEVLATGVASLKSLSETDQAIVYTGFGKIEQAANGAEVKPFTFDEAGAVAGFAFTTLKKLKEQYSDERKFAEMLEGFAKASENSKYPLAKLLNGKTLEVFKLDVDMGNFGQVQKGLSFLGKFGIGMTDAPEALSALTGFGESDLKNKGEIVGVMKKYFFTHTSESGVKDAVETLHEMVSEGEKSVSPEQLAKFVFALDNKDFERLTQLLTGKK